MGYEENKKELKRATELMLPLFLAVIDKMVEYNDHIWQDMVDEDGFQKLEKQKILKDKKSFHKLDVQAIQKLFYYRQKFVDCMQHALRLDEVSNHFKGWMHTAIDCRNAVSHESIDLDEFTDGFTELHLVNYRVLAEYLASVCPACKPYYEAYCNHYDPMLPRYVGHNTYSISDICKKHFPHLTEKEILHACIECNQDIIDKSIRATNLDSVISVLNDYFCKQEESHPYLETKINPCMDNLIGRKDLFVQIKDKLSEGHIATIYGMGGMGKSCSALKYAWEHRNDYLHIQYIFFEKSLRSTIRTLSFVGLPDESEMKNERKYENRMEILRKYGNKTLLIIDNMDVDKDDHYMDLMQLSCDIIITTRCRINGSDRHIIPIMPLSEDEQITLFRRHYFGNDSDMLSEDELFQLKELLAMINGHTLLIELSAKAIQNGALDFHNISEYLTEDKDVSDEIRVVKDNIPTQNSLDGFLNRLFDATKRTDAEKHVLSLMTLVPLDGMPQQLFKELAKLPNNNAITSLKNSSWIHSSGTGKDTRIFLHPMISKAVRNRVPATYNGAREFILNILSMLRKDNNENNALLCTIAKNIVMFITVTDKDLFACGIEFSRIVFDNMYYRNARLMLDKLVEADETVKDQGLSVQLYELRGDVYVRLAKYDDAIAAYQTASERHNHTYSGCSVWRLYNKRAFVFRKQSDYEKAQYFYKMAKEDLEKEAQVDASLLRDLATTYNDMGILYLNINEYDNALEYYRKGLDIRNELTEKNYKELAYSYHNIGTAYQKKKEFDKAKEYHYKGLQIRLKNAKLPDDHPDVMASMTQLGNDCIGSREFEDARRYINDALQIRLRHFEEDHPDIAWSYYSLAQLHKAEGDIESAKNYLRKCIDIRVKVLGKGHKYTLNAEKELKDLE